MTTEFVCPEAEFHGKPFRYCPVKGCGWVETPHLVTFGVALEGMKREQRWTRQGWNGKGMYVFLHNFSDDDTHVEPVFCMFTAQGKIQPGWLASQADMLAEDWVVFS